MNTALNRLQELYSDREFPPFAESFNWLSRFPLSYWQTAVILLLTVVLSLTLARLFWLVFAPGPQAAPASQTVLMRPAMQMSGGDAAVDIAALKALYLFGNIDAQPAEQASQQAVEQPIVLAAEETKLDLVLRGVVDSSEPDAARAIIARNNQQDIYAPGDTLPVGNRVTLDRVLADRVILNNSGRYESLLLYEEGAAFESDTARQSPQTLRQRPRRAIQVPESVKQALESGNVPGSINDVIKLTVAREGNQVIGYRVRPGRYRQLFDQLGFKAGDVVTHVNGLAVDDPSKAMSVYREVRTADAARFDLLREDQVITLEVDLADIEADDGDS